MHTDCWNAIKLDWPIYGTHLEKLRFLLNIALLAPSSRNTQPWRFHLTDHYLDIFADITRGQPIMDPYHRELIISCGTLIRYLQIAAHRFSHHLDIDYYPDPQRPDWLARFRIQPWDPATDKDILLFNAIPRRHSNRFPYQPEAIPSHELRLLESYVDATGTDLKILTPGYQYSAVGNLITRGNQLQAQDPAFRKELAEWLRVNHSDSEDGIPGYAFGIGDLASSLEAFMVKTFNRSTKQSRHDLSLIRHSAALLILFSDTDSPPAWLKTGESLAQLLLGLTAHHLHASFLNQPIECPELRIRLQKLFKTAAYPQIILRIGYSSVSVPPTPRRALPHQLTITRANYLAC